MRTRLAFWVLAALAALAIGCGKAGTTVVTDGEGNKVTASQDGDTVTVETDKGEKATYTSDGKDGGTMTYSGKDGEQKLEVGKGVSEDDLGMPCFPGSKEKPGGDVKSDTPEAKVVVSVRTTSEPASKVAEFYKPKLKEATSVSNDGNEMLAGKLENGAEVTIVAGRSAGETETTVTVSVSTKK